LYTNEAIYDLQINILIRWRES